MDPLPRVSIGPRVKLHVGFGILSTPLIRFGSGSFLATDIPKPAGTIARLATMGLADSMDLALGILWGSKPQYSLGAFALR